MRKRVHEHVHVTVPWIGEIDHCALGGERTVERVEVSDDHHLTATLIWTILVLLIRIRYPSHLL